MCWVCVLTVNIGLHKPAYQHKPLIREDMTYDASNAVDGRKAGRVVNVRYHCTTTPLFGG